MKPTVTESAGISPLSELVDDWEGALSRTTSAETFSVAGRRVRITSADRTLANKMQRALAHLRDNDRGAPSLHVLLCEGKQLDTDPYRIFGRAMSGSSDPVIISGNGWRSRLDPREGLLNVLDRTSGKAVFWVAHRSSLPYWDENAPLRHIFNWWLELEGFRIVHAAGVGTSSSGALVVGAAGSGKSTVALSCLESGLHCSGDDYQLLQTIGDPHVFSLYSCVKLKRDNIARFPRLAGLADIVDEKARFFLHEICPDELIRGFPIRAVLVPKVTGDTCRLEPISAGKALAALAPSSILQLHPVKGDPLGAMAEIISKVRTFRLELGADIGSIPSLVQEALG